MTASTDTRSSTGSSLPSPAFDPFDQRWSSNPFPFYAELRQRAPVHRSELGFWVFSRHADCLSLLRDRRASADGEHADRSRLSVAFREQPSTDNPVSQAITESRPFLFRDPPDHTRLRGLVAKAFTPHVVERLRTRTHQVVDELLSAALESDEVDLVESFAYPLPVRIICDLLGVPIEDQSLFKAWSTSLARGLDPDFLLPQQVIDERSAAVTELAQYFFSLLAERRRSPGEDLLSRLALAEDGGATLSEAELLSTCILLLVAGHETTVNLIAGGVVALHAHPDQRVRFRDDPGAVRTGVEEMLRYVSPVQVTARSMIEDIEIAGVRMQAGDLALLLLGSANHDQEAFSEPETFDVTRTPNSHLGFGFGIHHCLGAPLARMEAQVALSSLVHRAPRLSVQTDGLTYKTNVVLRAMETLPVRMRG